VRVGHAPSEIRVLDRARGTLTKLPIDAWGSSRPTWSRDGKQLALACGEANPLDLCLVNSDGTGPVRRVKADGIGRVPTSFSPDDSVLALGAVDPKTNLGLNLLTFSIADGKTTPFLETTAEEGYGDFSPDGKWMLYVSQEGNAPPGVFVRAYPDGSALRQVSDVRGALPFWTKKGTEIVYASLSPGEITLWAVSVRLAGGALELGKPEKLFEQPIATPEGSAFYHVTEDGNRFVVSFAEPAPAAPERRHVTIVFNFLEEIRRQLAK
jgi:Tol biopolymer transport system component